MIINYGCWLFWVINYSWKPVPTTVDNNQEWLTGSNWLLTNSVAGKRLLPGTIRLISQKVVGCWMCAAWVKWNMANENQLVHGWWLISAHPWTKKPTVSPQTIQVWYQASAKPVLHQVKCCHKIVVEDSQWNVPGVFDPLFRATFLAKAIAIS